MRKYSACLAVSLGVLAACGPLAPIGASVAPGIAAAGYRTLDGDLYAKFRLAPQLPKPGSERSAVKLTYLMTDDGYGHQSPDSLNIMQLMQTLPQRNVHNVIFRDGKENGDSRLFYLQNGKDSLVDSLLAPGVNEVQSNNPKVFAETLAWTLDTYKAKYRYLQLYTHGAGLFGIGTDSMQTDLLGRPVSEREKIDAIGIPTLAEAFRRALKGRQLDLIYNQACLMGNAEALYELRGTTRYVLASEDVTYSTANFSITLTKLFEDLANKGSEPAAIAKAMAIQGLAKQTYLPDGTRTGFTTLAAFDMSRIDETKTAINELSLALIATLPQERDAIGSAYAAVPLVTGDEPTSSPLQSMRDLWAFTAQLDQRVKASRVKAAIQRVRTEQRRLMLHERDSFGTAANGMSIFMPQMGDGRFNAAFIKGQYQHLRFAKDTAWDDFLVAILSDQ